MLGYYLQINSGYESEFSTTVTKAVSDTSNEHIFENLIAGASYKFRIAAFNLLEANNKQFDDILNYSEASEYIVANVPEKVTVFSQTLTGYEAGKIKMEWQVPSSENGSLILYYVVTRDVGSGVYF